MATREDLYKKFSPKLLEALVLLLRDKVPELQAFTGQQILNALETKYNTLSDYDWMDEDNAPE